VTPIALTSSVTGHDSDASFTLLQPIGREKLDSVSTAHGERKRENEMMEAVAPSNVPQDSRHNKWQPVLAKTASLLSDAPACQNGGNQFRILRVASDPGAGSAEFSRTGLEGLVGFTGPSGNVSHYNHDDFSVTLQLPPTSTPGDNSESSASSAATVTMVTLASEQDTNSDRSCALMSADCRNDTHAFFLYRCSDKARPAAATTAAATALVGATGNRFQVVVYYSLPATAAQFVDKQLVVCQLDAIGRACDSAATAAFTVRNTILWDGLHKLQ
jgi:hypothetical protein